MIIAKAQGLFGPIWVLDHLGTRMLTIGHQVQGAAYLSPAGPDGMTPGPVASSLYMTGWLLAGAMNPNGSGLMLGLGSGCGAVALLNSCPGVDLTVVEIDPAIVEAAHQGFPLLDYYQDQGRLHIVTSDATAYAHEALERHDHFDFACLDAYQGTNALQAPEELLYAMSQCCSNLWLNCIDMPHGPKIQAIVDCLEACGKPVVAIKPIHGGESQQNVILSTQDIDPGLVAAFTPYPDLDASDTNVKAARLAVTHLAAS